MRSWIRKPDDAKSVLVARYGSVAKGYAPCEALQMIKIKNLCASLLALSPTTAIADEHRIMLSEDLGLSTVCWQSPFEEGWEDVFGELSPWEEGRRSGYRYGLWQFGPVAAPAVGFFEEPFQFRLIVHSFPCYYEYENHRYVGAGTYLDSSGPPHTLEVDGYRFPFLLDEADIVPIIRSLIEQCEQSYPQPWPFRHLFPSLQDCETEISDILVVETTAIYLYLDPTMPSEFETVVFVQGLPYHDGAPLLDPRAMGLH